MKRMLIVQVFLVASLAFAGIAWAEQRVGFVDGDKVVLESPQYEALQKELEAEFKRRDNELVAKQKQLKKLEDKLERDGAVMSEDERKRLERDIVSRRRQLKNTVEEFQDDFNLRRSEARQKLQRQVTEVIREVGKAERYDLIFSAGVVYYSKRVDISDKVLERLRDEFKASKK